MANSNPSRRDAYEDKSPQAQTHPLHTDEDVVRLRKLVRELSVEIGLSLVDQTKTITAASELARNTLRYAGSGEVRIELLTNGLERGLRVTFADRGPGIPDVQLAMTDGYTSGGGLGLGLGGAKRLVDEFSIDTRVGEGTTVVITKWKRR
jgi:serine/threonine-protein kinase RsbT